MAVTRMEIVRREPYEGGRGFGAGAGPYERIDAIAHYAVDPAHAANAGIVDLDRADRYDDGRVHFSGDATFLVPADPGRAKPRPALRGAEPRQPHRHALVQHGALRPHADGRNLPRGRLPPRTRVVRRVVRMALGRPPPVHPDGASRPPPCRRRTDPPPAGCSFASSPTGRPIPSRSPTTTSAR